MRQCHVSPALRAIWVQPTKFSEACYSIITELQFCTILSSAKNFYLMQNYSMQTMRTRLKYVYCECGDCSCCGLRRSCQRERVYRERVIQLPHGAAPHHHHYPTNAVKNTKYNIFTFLPLVRVCPPYPNWKKDT